MSQLAKGDVMEGGLVLRCPTGGEDSAAAALAAALVTAVSAGLTLNSRYRRSSIWEVVCSRNYSLSAKYLKFVSAAFFTEIS